MNFPTPLLPNRRTINRAHIEHTGVAYWVIDETDGLPLDGPFAYISNARRTCAAHLANGTPAVVTDGTAAV